MYKIARVKKEVSHVAEINQQRRICLAPVFLLSWSNCRLMPENDSSWFQEDDSWRRQTSRGGPIETSLIDRCCARKHQFHVNVG
jgi:hypothetical protein